jgi:glycerophosphoryl diester phosphodiesterase
MNNLHVLELSAYTTPTIQESKRDNWVEFGDDNNYFQFIIDRYVGSTTNSSVINNVSRLIYGRGLSALDANKKPNEYAQMMSLFHKDCIRKIVLDRKMFGQFAIQVHYSKDHKKILKAYHMPVNLLRAEKCNKDGEIEGYYYSDNWEDTRNYVPKRIPAFGYSNEQVEILYSKPYAVGMKYYALPDYQGGLPYAKLEEEIADYLINEVQNGFSGTKVVNFNNGVPTEEQQQIIKSKVLSQLTGSRGQKVIVAFNNNQESKTTVDDLPLNDAPEHYTYLSEECVKKIMLAHNVTSPLLFGLGSANGFSSNADEIKNASILFDNMVIKPIQDEIIETFDKVLHFNGINLKLFFKTLQPLEFVDLENAQTEEQVAEETGTELSKDYEVAQSLIELGEDEPENSILIDEFPVDYDLDDKENETLSKELKTSFLSKIVNLVSTGDARPNIRSNQDEVIDGIKFITRYVYAGQTSEKSREFCKRMMAANKIYRKEDIIKMSSQAVNEGWGPKGSNIYSIWFYKGGGNCHHRWNKRVYATFSGKAIDVESKELKQVAVKKAEKLGYVVKNDPKVSQLPKDMPYNGFLPTNKIYGE